MTLSPSVIITNRKVPVFVGLLVIIPVIIALLFTRQILPYSSTTETMLFIATIILCYGIGSWFLLKFTGKASKELREKSTLLRGIHKSVTIIQFVFLGIMVLVLLNSERILPTLFDDELILPRLVYAISSGFAAIIMGLISFKFLYWFKAYKSDYQTKAKGNKIESLAVSWHKVSKRSFVVLFFGLAIASLALVITNDAWSKLLLVKVVKESIPEGEALGTFWIYASEKKYDGRVQLNSTNADFALKFVVPDENYLAYSTVNFISMFWRVFVWVGIAALLYQYYRRVGSFPKKFWIYLCIPMVLFLIGSNLVINVSAGTPNRELYQLLFRLGTIASSVLFGLSFLIVARSIPDGRETAIRIKDYLTISAIGIVILGLAFPTSALQPTYGIAAHSLVLLGAYLFSFGLYFSAIVIAYDIRMRNSIKSMTGSSLLSNIGNAQFDQELKNQVRKFAEEQQEHLSEQAGLRFPPADPDRYRPEVMKQMLPDNEKTT